MDRLTGVHEYEKRWDKNNSKRRNAYALEWIKNNPEAHRAIRDRANAKRYIRKNTVMFGNKIPQVLLQYRIGQLQLNRKIKERANSS